MAPLLTLEGQVISASLLWLLGALTLVLLRRRQTRREPLSWAARCRGAKRVLLVGLEGLGDTLDLADLAKAFGTEVACLKGGRGADWRDHLNHSGEYGAIVLDSYLSDFPEDVARQLLLHFCGLLAVHGTLFIRDVAVVPTHWSVMLLRAYVHDLPRILLDLLLCTSGPRGPPFDFSDWLPATMDLVSRSADGLLQEDLAVQRRAAPPNGAVERLRRSFGDTSMAYCTSPEANRIGGPESSIRYYLAAPRGERADGRNETGYVAYVEHVVIGARLRLVIMDPVCAAEDRDAILWGFLSACEAVGARVIFSCISADFVRALRDFGFHTTMLGAEVGIPLATYASSKERRRYLRAAPAKGLECQAECQDFAELQALNRAWVASKASGTEVMIWTWPPSLPRADADPPHDEPEPAPADSGGCDDSPQPRRGDRDEVRRLFTYQDGRLVGFVCAEPYYRGDGSGEVLGYGLNTIRFLPNLSPPWISDFTVATLVQSLQRETRADLLAFGLSPWSEMCAHIGDLAWLRRLFYLLWEANVEEVYPIQGLAKKKAHHCAGQGVRLHDRFIAGLPEYAFGDTVRFTYLLLGNCLAKLPQGILALAARASCSAAGAVAQTAKGYLAWWRARGRLGRRAARAPAAAASAACPGSTPRPESE